MKASKKQRIPVLVLSVFVAVLFLVFAFIDANSQTVCLTSGRGCALAEIVAKILGVGINIGKAFYDVGISIVFMYIGVWHYQITA
ncbi:MAG: hypothetical protein V4445_05185 [Pseudomonadota bacterium]